MIITLFNSLFFNSSLIQPPPQPHSVYTAFWWDTLLRTCSLRPMNVVIFWQIMKLPSPKMLRVSLSTTSDFFLDVISHPCGIWFHQRWFCQPFKNRLLHLLEMESLGLIDSSYIDSILTNYLGGKLLKEPQVAGTVNIQQHITWRSYRYSAWLIVLINRKDVWTTFCGPWESWRNSSYLFIIKPTWDSLGCIEC